MKYLIPGCLSLALVLSIWSLTSSCNGTNSDTPTQLTDSLLIADIESYREYVNNTFGRSENTIYLDASETRQERIVWTETPADGLIKIVWGISSDSAVIRQTYFLRENQIVYYRDQQWFKFEPSTADQEVHYFNNGKLKKHVRKFMELEPGKPPVNMVSMQPMRDKTDYAEKEAKALKRFDEIMKIREENRQ